MPGGVFTILLFHSIDGRGLLSLKDLGNIRPELFEKVIKSLKKEFDIVSLRQAVEGIQDRLTAKARLLAITFDDGPESYATAAVPIMEAHGVPSTCFLITGCIDDKTPYWRYLYNYAAHCGLVKELVELVNKEYGVAASEEGVLSFTRNNFDRRKTLRIISELLRLVRPEEYAERETKLFLSADDISMLKTKPLVAFGIHTQSHPVMAGLSGAEISEEISSSIEFYRKEIEDCAPMFSIPFGRLYRDYDERTVIAAQQLGVEYIFSAYGGSNMKRQPPYNIRRIPVTEDMLRGGTEGFLKLLDLRSREDTYGGAERRLSESVARSGIGPWKTRFS